MRALVLAAGLGTRLRPLTSVRAKAAVPVNGEPLVARVIRGWCPKGSAIWSSIFTTSRHRSRRSSATARELGARVRYSWEQPVLGSAGGPRHALPLLVDVPSATDVPAGQRRHADHPAACAASPRRTAIGALVTMALIPNPRPDKYGGVLVDDGWVRGFTRAGSGERSYHFIGVQVARARAFLSSRTACRPNR